MAYVCWKELISMASQRGDNEHFEEYQTLARAAAPLLILRLAIPIRAYISDQPLRGRRPQPLSELEELLFSFQEIGTLKLQDGAVEEGSGEKAHLKYLYPLLVQAVSTAGDKWSGAEEVLGPLKDVLANVSSVPGAER